MSGGESFKRFYSLLPPLRQLFDGPMVHGRGPVSKQARQFGHVHFRPCEFCPARIFNFGSILTANAVNRAQHIRFMQGRRRTAKLVPAARVDHEQAAIGVFKHVCWMKIEIVRDQEVVVVRFERRPFGLQNVPADFVLVELTREQVVLVFLAEDL